MKRESGYNLDLRHHRHHHKGKVLVDVRKRVMMQSWYIQLSRASDPANVALLTPLTYDMLLEFARNAAVPDERPELAMEHRTLHAQLHDPELQASPQRWACLVQAAKAFPDCFSRAYIVHHDDYHARIGLLGHQTRDMHLRASALEMLNTVVELGEPVASELPGIVEEVHNAIGSCHVVLTMADLIDEAACSRCGITLSSEPPELEAAQLHGYVREALDMQNGRLSRFVVRRLLARDGHERVDKLIQAVQASDLKSQAKIMDHELVDFIRDLLREPLGSAGAG